MNGNTVLEMLAQRAAETPDRTAVIYEPEERVTYAQLWELSGRIYAWLKQRGIGAEDVVMYTLPRGIGLYACMAGTMRAGAAFVLTESANDPARTEFIRKDCECRVQVREREWADILNTEPAEGYEEIRLHNLCYIAYTSGTTAQPKGVLHEYGSLENAWKSSRMNGRALMGPEDTFLVMSPMNFVSMPIVFAGSCADGDTVALMPPSYGKSQDMFEDYVERTGVNCAYFTPSFLRSHLPFRRPFRVCLLASEPADGLFVENSTCYNCYASTEAGCLLSVYHLTQPMTPAPVGKSQSDIEIYVLDEEEMEVPVGTVGEVCYRNPYVRGYLNLPEKTRELLRGRVFHTGDAGKLDREGNLFICGRLDEMFKIGGYRIEPYEVANAVREVSGLRHLVVRGFVYKDLSSIIVFYTDPVDVDEVELREKLLKRLPEYMIPTSYIRLRDFPLLKTGKLDRLSLLPPEGNWDEFRRMAASALPLLGKGRTASVYALGDKKVLKCFRLSVPFEIIRQELVMMQVAHAAGLPSPEVYEIVRYGSHLGIVMERFEGKELEDVLKNPEERKEWISRFADFVRQIHGTTISDKRIPDKKAVCIFLTGQYDPSFCSPEEAAKIRSVFERIPDCDGFVHGDCHGGNVMVSDGKMKMIDLMLSGKGHPVFDLLCMYSHYVFLPSFGTDENCQSRLGMNRAEAESVYETFLRAYYRRNEGEDLTEIKEWIRGIHSARITLASIVMPGVFSKEVLCAARDRAIRFAEQEQTGFGGMGKG